MAKHKSINPFSKVNNDTGFGNNPGSYGGRFINFFIYPAFQIAFKGDFTGYSNFSRITSGIWKESKEILGNITFYFTYFSSLNYLQFSCRFGAIGQTIFFNRNDSIPVKFYNHCIYALEFFTFFWNWNR